MTLGLSANWWSAGATLEDDRLAITGLDLEYQAAVKRNDAAVIDRILHPDYFLMLGDGTLIGREELLDEARMRTNAFEIRHEEEGTQVVRVWGNTAVVTARLRIKGTNRKGAFDRTLWFSDTYVRTPTGWRCAFGQASLPLPLEKLNGKE